MTFSNPNFHARVRFPAGLFRPIIGAMCVLTIAAACGKKSEEQTLPNDGRAPKSLIPVETAQERVFSKTVLGKSWRDAVRLDGGARHSFAATALQPGDTIRWGLREEKPASGGETKPVEMQWNDGKTQSIASAGSTDWQEFSVTVSDGYVPGTDATLTLSSSATFWLSHAEVVPRSQLAPPVIVVLIDTLRQDHLHCYGYERETSPNIDAFRNDSVMFSQLVPPSSWTRPSVASLLTSVYPGVHGAQDRGDRVRSGVTWLADVIDGQGYESHAVLTNPNCFSAWGFGDDFDCAFEMETADWMTADTDTDAMDIGIRTIRELGHRPYFMYLHMLAPHSPYAPPPPYDTRFTGGNGKLNGTQQHTLNLYDGEIAYFDDLFGDMITALKAQGVYDSSLIVLLSDHGEEFWDHGGTAHGHTLYEEQLRVPLLIKFPKNRFAGASFDGLVEMVDVAPTLLDILDMTPPADFQGVSVLPYIGEEELPQRVGYAELFLDEKSMRSTKTPELKFIDDAVKQEKTFFDLTQDPLELTPLDDAPANAGLLRQYSERIAMLGNGGLHILITQDATQSFQISGSIQSDTLGEVSIRYPETLSEMTKESDRTVHFAATFPLPDDPRVPSVHWQQAMEGDNFLKMFVGGIKEGTVSEQNYAELVADVDLEDTVRIELRMDGEVFPEAQTHLGAMGQASGLDGATIRIADIVASPSAFNLASLPQGTAVYIWYLPGTEVIADEDLEPELRESLEALGYITN